MDQKIEQLLDGFYRAKMAENGHKSWKSRDKEKQKEHIKLMCRKRWIGWKKNQELNKLRIKNNK